MIQKADRSLAVGGLAALGLGLAAWRAYPADGAQPKGLLLINGGLVLVGLGLASVGLVGLVRAPKPAAPDTDWPRRSIPPVLGALAGTALAAFGLHLSLVYLGAIVALWSAWLAEAEPGKRRLPAAPALGLLLIPAYLLLATISGPEGLGMSALPLAPVSPAAERLIAPGLILAAWASAGLWPMHRHRASALAAPAAAIMLVRVGMLVAPEGMAYWRPAAYPLLVVGIWHAALDRRRTPVAVGTALMGVLTLDPHGIAGAAWLLAATVGHEAMQVTRRHPAPARAALAVAALWGGLEIATAGLRVEVVYTVLAVAGAGLAMTAKAPKKGEVSAEAPSVATR